MYIGIDIGKIDIGKILLNPNEFFAYQAARISASEKTGAYAYKF